MASAKDYPNDFSIQLLKKIDVLLTQLELYLKQTKTARSNEQYPVQPCNRAEDTPDQLQLLQHGLTEKDSSSDNRNGEIEQARTLLAELQRRFVALQAELQQGVEILQKQEATTSQLEQALRAEIERLRTEGQEKHFLLGSRNEEVMQAKAELDQLRGRYTELERAAEQLAAEAAAENNLMETEFQAKLALLQAELSQKEWALEEKQAIVNGLEQRFNARIQDLQMQLAEKQTQAETHSGDVLLGEMASSIAQNRKSTTLEEPIKVSESQTRLNKNHGRRWRTGGVRKRRWKSP
jgi:DNA repair exonuclease SbcCD ATPase subunit